MCNICGVQLWVDVVLCLCASTHSGSHDCCVGGAAEGCSEDAEAADEKCDSGVCIHRSKQGYIR